MNTYNIMNLVSNNFWYVCQCEFSYPLGFSLIYFTWNQTVSFHSLPFVLVFDLLCFFYLFYHINSRLYIFIMEFCIYILLTFYKILTRFIWLICLKVLLKIYLKFLYERCSLSLYYYFCHPTFIFLPFV